VAAEATAAIQRAKLGSEAVIHTTMGDIFIKLLPDSAPKAIENFCGHSRAGYYDNLLFHRVIKDFMIQVGRRTTSHGRGVSDRRGPTAHARSACAVVDHPPPRPPAHGMPADW